MPVVVAAAAESVSVVDIATFDVAAAVAVDDVAAVDDAEIDDYNLVHLNDLIDTVNVDVDLVVNYVDYLKIGGVEHDDDAV